MAEPRQMVAQKEESQEAVCSGKEGTGFCHVPELSEVPIKVLKMSRLGYNI